MGSEILYALRKNFYELYEQCDYINVVICGERILNEHVSYGDRESLDFADDEFNLARAYDDMRSYSRAMELYADSARIVKNFFGENITYTYRINNQAIIHCKQGEYDKALPLLTLVADIKRKYGGETEDLLDSLYNLANALADAGRNDEALKLHAEILARREQKNIDYVNGLSSISYIYENINKIPEAIAYTKKAATYLKRIVGTEDDEVYRNNYYLAILFEKNDEPERAQRILKKCLKWIEASVGRNNHFYAGTLIRIANINEKIGNDDKALKLRLESLKIIKDTIGENHLYYANCLRNVAMNYKQNKDFEKAKRYLLKELEIKEKLIGKTSLEYMADLLLLVGIFVENTEYVAALDIFVKTLDELKVNDESFYNMLYEMAKVYLPTDEESEKGFEPSKSIGSIVKKMKELNFDAISGGAFGGAPEQSADSPAE